MVQSHRQRVAVSSIWRMGRETPSTLIPKGKIKFTQVKTFFSFVCLVFATYPNRYTCTKRNRQCFARFRAYAQCRVDGRKHLKCRFLEPAKTSQDFHETHQNRTWSVPECKTTEGNLAQDFMVEIFDLKQQISGLQITALQETK